MPFFTTTDNCRLYFTWPEPDPALPVVVLLNGLAQTTAYWQRQQLYFKRTFQILRYDARGQGQSAVGNRPLSPEQHVADLLALFDSLGIDRASLVGLSHGAYVAAAFTAAHPDRVQKLVVCSLRASLYGASQIVARWLKKITGEGLESFSRDVIAAATGKTFRASHTGLMEMMARAVAARNNADGLAAQLAAMGAYPPATDLAAVIRVPALVLAGAEDTIVPPEDAETLAAAMRAPLHRIPRAGHSLPVEAPKAFNAAISNFLSRPI